jgi:hypothetical protein
MRNLSASILLVATACGGNDQFTEGKDGFARVSVGLTASARAEAGGATEAILAVDRVTVKAEGGWVTLRDSIDVTVDVLQLGDSYEALGFADLPPGRIKEIRLHVDGDQPSYVTLENGDRVPLKVPSGESSGLKIKGDWQLDECTETRIELDLDGKKAIGLHATGKNDLWILRPTIKAGHTVLAGDCDGDPGDETPPGEEVPPTDPLPVDGEPGEPTEPMTQPPTNCGDSFECGAGGICNDGVCIGI